MQLLPDPPGCLIITQEYEQALANLKKGSEACTWLLGFNTLLSREAAAIAAWVLAHQHTP
jgi:hypothetical protein